MSKAVLISIQPRWCERIANGEKTVEIRKTRPKLETPFKCYIYMTSGNASIPNGKGMVHHHSGGRCIIGEFVCDFIIQYESELWDDETFERIQERYEPEDFVEYGEYVYKSVADNSDEFWRDNVLCRASGISVEELRKYIGTGIHEFYGWHISGLKIYDRPKPLSEFVVEGDCDCLKCKQCSWFDKGNGFDVEDDCNLAYENTQRKEPLKPLFRPPQSWRYVEELEGGDPDGTERS